MEVPFIYIIGVELNENLSGKPIVRKIRAARHVAPISNSTKSTYIPT